MHKKQIPMQKLICMKCLQTSHVEDDQFLHWSQMNTFPVLHAFIGNVRLSAGWIDLMGNPI